MSALRECLTGVSVKFLCCVFGYSKQAYYKTCRVHAHEELKECMVLEMVDEYRSQMGRLGGRKLHYLIRSRLPGDLRMGRDQFFRLLGAHGYLLRNHRVRVRTTNSYHHYHRFPNLIRDFSPDGPCQLYVSDITYLLGKDGVFYYLCLVTDAYSRKIMGWCVWDTLEMYGPLEALKMALAQTPLGARLIHHSDRGVQYCSHEYVKMLQGACLAEVSISMTQSGDPLENAIAERVNGILKTEWLNQMELTSLEDARRKVGQVVWLYETDTRSSVGKRNVYGNSSSDLVYSFTLTVAMDLVISTCGSDIDDTCVYLLTAPGKSLMGENDDYYGSDGCGKTTQAYLKMTNVPAGSYYVVSEGYNRDGNITTRIEGIARIENSSGNGNTEATAINIGIKTTDFVYSDTKNTNNFTCNYNPSFNPMNDVFYKFTLNRAMDVTVSHCGSEVSDTQAYILVANGNFSRTYVWNDDSWDTGACSNPYQAYIKAYRLEPGTYYVVSKGKTTNGNITTRIEGTVSTGTVRKGTNMSNPIDIGSKSSDFTFRDTQDIDHYGDNYVYDPNNRNHDFYGAPDIFYKLTLTGSMEIKIWHEDIWTYSFVHVLNSSGTAIVHAIGDDNGKPVNLSIDLSPGIYYIVVEDYNSNTSTIIEGKVYKSNPSIDKNYIQTYTPTSATSQLTGIRPDKAIQEIQYFDGLGRPIQTTQIKGRGTGAEMVTYQEYDALGRESNNWLPAAISENGGAFVALANFKTNASRSYSGDTKTYSQPLYEASPLNRLSEQYGPGQDWHNNQKRTRIAYLGNVAGNDTLNCIHFTVAETKSDTLLTLTKVKNYASGNLVVIRTEDEGGGTSFEFKDKRDRTLLTRQIIRSGSSKVLHDTYYIYDDFGCLMMVLPPEASDVFRTSTATTWSSKTDATLKNYAYLYKYNSRNLCIAKKLPGCSWNYYIYDRAGRMIFSQDGEQRIRREWLFSIPDALGRVTVTGICTNTLSALTDFPISGIVTTRRDNSTATYKGYAAPSNITLSGVKIVSINYYDDYAFLNKSAISEFNNSNFAFVSDATYATTYHATPRGLPTGTLTAVLDGNTVVRNLGQVMYYDYRARVIQSNVSNNLTGTDKELIAYNFAGWTLKSKKTHAAPSKETITEEYTNTYDNMGRLLTTVHQVKTISTSGATSTKPAVTLVSNEYDELGRLKVSESGSQANLRKEYNYNVRSWITGINNNLFKQNLTYNYNGNIKTQEWNQDGKTRKYTFTYDNLSRITAATYTGDMNFATSYSYDKQGNIKTLSRYGMTSASVSGLIDNLTMSYVGNQLIKADDSGVNSTLTTSNDFRDGVKVVTEYFYDTNGNLKKDLNKGISEIQYNFLNLPSRLVISGARGSSTNTYVYGADGSKLSVSRGTKKTDYIGNVIYENGVFKRLLVGDGYYEGGKYYFYVRDHLGNNRIVTDQDGVIRQSTHYYPFGMSFADVTGADVQPYRFGDKEEDTTAGLNLYDFHARQYEPAIGRFTSMDPVAEKYYAWSPYSYTGGNPLLNIDPTGRDWYSYFDKEKNEYQYTWNETIQSAKDMEKQGIQGEYLGKTYKNENTYYGLIGGTHSLDNVNSRIIEKMDEAIINYYDSKKESEKHSPWTSEDVSYERLANFDVGIYKRGNDVVHHFKYKGADVYYFKIASGVKNRGKFGTWGRDKFESNSNRNTGNMESGYSVDFERNDGGSGNNAINTPKSIKMVFPDIKAKSEHRNKVLKAVGYGK